MAVKANSTGQSGVEADADTLPVRPGEDPWTSEEVAQVRAELEDDIARIAEELQFSESDLAGLMRDYGGGSGDDSADTGGKVLEREQNLTLTQNSRKLLEQNQRALERIDSGSYGRCESCGEPIGKMRLQAFPRATLCVPCKQKQERR
ncbi:DnaK suppressor protein [Kineosphaera limosa]|uniref:Zinc finger DksA/TraR C4-type domain-containing protein n=1 Tax=Kineosphaera limosa NBRC 100340 TaxID=1184609 RepID=K6WAR6_9MICO|nr:TraR/DksA C4-type zinc finger protein [Kineosphaera limosa]NYD99252.1 DnaK suppressor protein [Kineosphaera limosa]GAB96290.1 hypothetical protein KILIM_034_00390 [Kineosphaera limosa NBRC 100340]